MGTAEQQRSAQGTWDVIVLGAGAAGLFCAALAGRRGRRVLLLEGGERAGRKILISGGGRCNFTNLHTTPANYLSENPHFAKSALARYTPRDFIALMEKHRIAYHEKTLGQLFCDGSAQQVVAMLERECAEAGVEIRLRSPVDGVRAMADGGFAVSTAAGEVRGRTVVVCTGGLSIPKLGATGAGYAIARSFGLKIVEPCPALVPLTFAPDDLARWLPLAGVSAEVIASSEGRGRNRPPTFQEKLLFTHRGLSGPAVLQISSYWKPGTPLAFDLLPSRRAFETLLASTARRDAATAFALLREHLSTRLAERWLAEYLPADWKNPSIAALEAQLHAWTVTPAGTEGFAKAEVTVGGVSTTELDSATLQAKRVPGLAFIGEVVDVTGHLGGFNFQWAWASAYAAAQAL